MYFALVVVVTKFHQTGELKEIALGAKKIATFRALLQRLGFQKDNVFVVSDVEGEDGAECTSTPEKMISHLTSEVKSRVSGGVLVTFVVTHGVRLLNEEGSEPGLCMKQSRFDKITNGWTNVLPVKTLGKTLRGIGAESVLLVLDACHGAFCHEEEWRNEVEGFTQISSRPHFLREAAPEESIRGMYLLFSISSEEKGHEGSHLTKFIDECLSGRGRVDEHGNVRASHFVLQLCRGMPHPPHLSVWRMHKSQDFVLSPRPVVTDSPIPVRNLESVFVNDYKKDADDLMNMVKAKLQSIESILFQESEQLIDVLSSMEKLLERIKEERKGMDEGCVDYGTPSRISLYRHSWENLLTDLGVFTTVEQNTAISRIEDKVEDLEPSDALQPPFLFTEQICLDRQSEVDELWKKVCGSESGVVGIVGVHGQGGIGKTILAQLLLRHPEVKAEFPDGKYWITVGEFDNPAELLENQTQLYRVLTKERDASFSSVAKARTALERIIGEKRCLVVLDNVWKSRNVIGSFGSNALQKVNSPCRFLVTTRDASLVDKKMLYKLEYLTVEETVRPLKKESGLGGEVNENQLKDLASRCGTSPIPLVVSIVGGLLQEYLESTPDFEEAVNQVCELIDDTGIIYKSVPHALGDHEKTWETTLMSSVEAVCHDKNLSRYGVKNLIYDLSVFPDDTKIPKKLLESVWIRRNVPKSLCTRLLTKLARMSIIQRFESNDNHFGIHDSVRSFMLANSEDVENRHGLVVNVYRDLCENADPWWKGKESQSLTREILDYMRVHLTYHLNSMQDHDSIFELVSSLDWVVYRSPLDVHLKDCEYLKQSGKYKETGRLISSALELSLLSWSKDPSREGLAFQLYSRLFKSGCKELDSMLKELDSVLPFEVVKSVLEPAGSPTSKLLERHTGLVNSIALSPDCHRAVSGSYDYKLRVWDLETGKCEKVLKGHTSHVTAVALTSDCLRAISGSVDNTLRAWDLETGECENVLKGHANWVTSVALTSDGHRAVSGSYDNTLRLWDLERGECERVLEGHFWHVTSVALTADDLRVVSGSSDNTLRVWNLETGECENMLEGHTREVYSVALSSDGLHAVSGSDDRTLRVWDLERGECERVLEGHTSYVTAVALTSDDLRAVSASYDHTLRVWDLERGECEKVLEGHTSSITSAALTSDGLHVVSGSSDNTLRVWDLETNRSTLYAVLAPYLVLSIAVNQHHIVFGLENGRLGIMRIK